MTIQEFNNLNAGDVLWFLSNTGAAGVFRYQYLGILNNHGDGLNYHVFASEKFLSTVAIEVGKEQRSRSINRLFKTEKEVKECKRLLIANDEEF